jgi:hypothetical protein
LNALTKRGVEFQWTRAAQEAFDTLKEKMTEAPVLAHPDLTKPFELEVDASGYAIGAVLLQRQDDGKRHPVNYFSTTLNAAERNYDIYDLELLAIVKSLRNSRSLLAGSPTKSRYILTISTYNIGGIPRRLVAESPEKWSNSPTTPSKYTT